MSDLHHIAWEQERNFLERVEKETLKPNFHLTVPLLVSYLFHHHTYDSMQDQLWHSLIKYGTE